MNEIFNQIKDKYEELSLSLSDSNIISDSNKMKEIAKQRSAIEETYNLYIQYEELEKKINELDNIDDDSDIDIMQMIKDEKKELTTQFTLLKDALKNSLIPNDPADQNDIILEIRAGTGGNEASLFAADLFTMYSKYALSIGWQVNAISSSGSSSGGYKEIIAEIKGKGAYSKFKYESGVHRVQRIPDTETQGRIHTSAATVAVLSAATNIDVEINWEDVRTDIFHSGGAGGQSVNKVATAVRLTHVPSGFVVICQDERSQSRNKQKAESVLRARLYEFEREKQHNERASERKLQVGTGGRSEKIRTYNFPQDRITDHRIKKTIHGMTKFLAGEIDIIINDLQQLEKKELLENSSFKNE
jgi:peptide chain release factor 1